MMLLMFAVGVMNVVWMAALGIVMTVEKLEYDDAILARARRRVHSRRRGVHREFDHGALACAGRMRE